MALTLKMSILAYVTNIVIMKALSIEATIVLNQMTGMMEDSYVKIDNSDGNFMPVYVALYRKSLGNRIIRVGHFTRIDGDIIADPEMRFLYDETEDIYYTFYYRQDCLGVEQESVKIVRSEITRVNRLLQESHTNFANQWIRNIKNQQNL